MSNNDLKKHTIFMCMVTTMVCISFFGTLGFSWQTMLQISAMLLIMWPTVFVIKEWVTTPIVKKVHKHVLAKVKHNKRHTVPFLTIFINSGIITLLLLWVSQMYPNNLLTVFLDTWEKKLIILIPLFFLFLRPVIEWTFNSENDQLVRLFELKNKSSRK